MRALLFFLLIGFCQLQAKEEILRYHSEIRVLRSGELEVVEEIKVRVENGEINRGIYRDFQQTSSDWLGLNDRKPFEVVSVTRNDKPEPFRVEEVGSGTKIWIGEEEVILEKGSVQDYRITYVTGRQLVFDEKGDELYWNVTGNFWAFPIKEASARVLLPDLEVRSVEAYTGEAGEKGSAYEARKTGNEAVFETTAPLEPGEGLTIVVRWDPGRLDEAAYSAPSVWEENRVQFMGAGIVLVGIGVVFLLWMAKGRGPAPGLVIPRWEPPVGFSPAGVRNLWKMGFDNICFSSGVLGLAAKGAASIEKTDETHILRSRNPTEPLTGLETSFCTALFKEGETLRLENSNHMVIGGARKVLKKGLKKMLVPEFYSPNYLYCVPGFLVTFLGAAVMTIGGGSGLAALFLLFWLSFSSLGTGLLLRQVVTNFRTGGKVGGVALALFSIPFVIGWFVGALFFVMTAGVVPAGFMIAGILTTVFAFAFMRAPTGKGRRFMDEIEGFREYLAVAEEDRLNLENPPEKTPELFEKFLPYALALGVEQQWAEKFDDILRAAAQDGSASRHGSFHTGSFTGHDGAFAAAAMGAALTGALASSASSPSSSGSDGGGSSGGGGGGGGGGGW